ncbi:hypothetical protein HYW75_05710 [Candidatus Pacearchaeota archaeon]|nr:hypothetical protein [Candidatus Pacearchaeota archaeon]
MENKVWIVGIIVLAILIIGGAYIYSIQKNPQLQTYEDCVQKILNDVRKYKPASEESIGAIRKDNEGITWKKVLNDTWETDAEKYNVGGGKTTWGDGLIDEQIGGAKYTSENFLQCQKYISTHNSEMEQKFTEIMNQIVQEQSQEGEVISIKKIEVLNLAGKVQGFINLDCKDIDLETEKVIVGNIAMKLFTDYSDDFNEGGKRNSWVDIYCNYNMGWRISDGDYGMMY